MRFAELQAARTVLGLPERASLAQIKARHRVLVKQLHPDGGAVDGEQIRRVNAAYQLLRSYCQGYRFNFSQQEFFEQHPEERLRHQFAQDPVWGGGEDSA